MNQQQGQQISIEDALAAFRKKCADLTDTSVLLEARAESLQRRVAELEEENARLRETPQEPQSAPYPVGEAV